MEGMGGGHRNYREPQLRFSIHDANSHVISLLQLNFGHYVWMPEDTEYFWTSNQRTKKYNNSSWRQTNENTVKANVVLVNVDGWDFTRTTSHDMLEAVCFTWKHQIIAFVY